MSEASQTCNPATLEAIPNAISSQGSLFGPTLSGSQDGPMTAKCGLAPARAQVSPVQAKGKGLQTLVTSGLSGIASSASVALEQSLVSRLQQRLDTAGSTLFVETWKRKSTPLRRRYWEHTARVRPTSGSGCTSLPTPTAEDRKQDNWTDKALNDAIESGLTPPSTSQRLRSFAGLSSVPTPRTVTGGAESAERKQELGRTESGGGDLQATALLASVPTPMAGSPKTESYSAAGNNDYSRRIVELATVPTPNAMEGGQTSRSGKRKGEMLMGGIAQLATCATPRSEDSQCAGAHRGAPDTLHSQVNLSAVTTPCATEARQGYQNRHNGKKGNQASLSTEIIEAVEGLDGSMRTRVKQLPTQAQLAVSGQTATGGTDETASTGQLDPAYSRWLQGLPPVFCDCAVTAMQSARSRRRRSSARTAKQEE